MANFTTTFTVGATTTNPFLIQDTTGNTGTGPLLQVNTVGTSAASPVEFTAQGTSNGVQMNTSGTLAAIGTGNINATQLQGITISTTTPTTNQVLTYNGTIWAPAAASSGSTFQITGSTPNENENGQNWLGISTFPTSETQAQWPMSVSGHITGMYINLSVAPGAASSTSWTLRLNKASQALQCSISGTSTSCSTTGSVAVSPGNLMDIDELSTTSPASSYITWAIAVGP